ncbi:SemiSWEET family sugar transporter [Methyloraptor flagellatus]|uniref:SemiSWEET transporter n=1 Tax=Methyloraptor flagellatus TaxID=3162530 RepID=A0AAU7XC26_9HYPH
MSQSLMVEALGGLAALFTTLCWLPQVVKVIRDRDTSSLSLTTFATLVTGLAFWLAYGVAIQSWPIIIANSLTLALNATILAVKLRYG